MEQPLSQEALLGPVRVLVETSTHLVPGENFLDKTFDMLDRICQLLWQRDYIAREDRYELYGNTYGYPNRRCYFLLDKGQVSQGESIYEIWYRWDGESLILQTEPISPEVRLRLDQVDFSSPSRSGRKPRSQDQKSQKSQRKLIRSLLRDLCPLSYDLILYLEQPEEQQWLQDNIEDRFFQQYKAQAEECRRYNLWDKYRTKDDNSESGQ